MVKEIALSNSNLVTIVDAEDFEWLRQYRWRLQPGRGDPYVVRSSGKGNKLILMHRQILGVGGGEYVDHRDRNTLNNTRQNLRSCTASQNQGNSVHPVGVSGYRGVARSGRRWQAKIKRFGRTFSLGTYDTPEEAAGIYDEAAIEHFGKDFARLNFADANREPGALLLTSFPYHPIPIGSSPDPSGGRVPESWSAKERKRR